MAMAAGALDQDDWTVVSSCGSSTDGSFVRVSRTDGDDNPPDTTDTGAVLFDDGGGQDNDAGSVASSSTEPPKNPTACASDAVSPIDALLVVLGGEHENASVFQKTILLLLSALTEKDRLGLLTFTSERALVVASLQEKIQTMNALSVFRSGHNKRRRNPAGGAGKGFGLAEKAINSFSGSPNTDCPSTKRKIIYLVGGSDATEAIESFSLPSGNQNTPNNTELHVFSVGSTAPGSCSSSFFYNIQTEADATEALGKSLQREVPSVLQELEAYRAILALVRRQESFMRKMRRPSFGSCEPAAHQRQHASSPKDRDDTTSLLSPKRRALGSSSAGCGRSGSDSSCSHSTSSGGSSTSDASSFHSRMSACSVSGSSNKAISGRRMPRRGGLDVVDSMELLRRSAKA